MDKQVSRVRGNIILEDEIRELSYSNNTNGYVLVFDTETYTKIHQRAKIAMFTIFDLSEASKHPENIEYVNSGMVVYDLSPNELITLKEYSKETVVKLYTKE